MRISKNNVWERENIAVIYSGLNSISAEGREQLKNIAQTLIDLQNRPGTPVPDNVCREIIKIPTSELLKEVK
jgi:hypothetical protein